MALFPRLMPNYLDGVFDDFFTPMKGDEFSKMKCDIYLKDDVYTMEMDIPGFDKQDVKIEVDDNDYLTITAEKSTSNDSEDDDKNYVRKERHFGKCSRSFYVGNIDESQVQAKLENGVLNITIPKEAPNPKQKRIEIK